MSKYQLTPVEFELMEILWKIGGGSVRDVMDLLPKQRNLAYTSVSTILRIMQQKKLVRAIKTGRQHYYQPLIDKENYTAYSVNKIINHVFAGNSRDLVAHLVSHEELSLEDIQSLQKLLAEKKKGLQS